MVELDDLKQLELGAKALATSITRKKEVKSAWVRTSTPAPLMDYLRDQFADETDQDVLLSNIDLVSLGLLNLVKEPMRSQLFHELKTGERTPLVKMIRQLDHAKTENQPSKLDKNALKRLENQTSDVLTIVYALLVSDTWLLQDRLGLNLQKGSWAKSPNDVFNFLRDDDLKAVISKTLLAGASERERQDHLNNPNEL